MCTIKTKLDHKKLKALIDAELPEIINGPACATSFAIGRLDGVEVFVKLTRDQDEMHNMKAATKCYYYEVNPASPIKSDDPHAASVFALHRRRQGFRP